MHTHARRTTTKRARTRLSTNREGMQVVADSENLQRNACKALAATVS